MILTQWVSRAMALFSALALGGCITTSDMPLTKNVWQVNTQSGGSLFVGQADKATMKHAAELTLAQGFNSFVIQNPQSQTGSVYVGSTPGVANTTVNVVGNTAYGTTFYTPGAPIIAPRKDVSVTVVMFHAGEPAAAQAIDAAGYLKQLNS